MRQSAKLLAVAVAGTLISMLASPARADPPAGPSAAPMPVALVVPRCVKASLPDLQRIVSVELGIEVTTQLEDVATPPDVAAGAARASAGEDANVTRVSIACSGTFVRLEVLDPISGKTLVRHLDLTKNEASTRTRMLGLSVAELVAASWIELAARPATRAHIVEAKASPSVRDAAIHSAERALAPPSFYRVEAVASAQRTGGADLLTLGGGVGGSWVHNGWQVVGADLLVETGGEDVSLGTIRTLLVSASASFRMRHRLGWVALEGGLGVRGGVASMQGIPAQITPHPEAASATLPWWGPMIMVRVDASIAERVGFVVGLEAGRVLYAADGQAAGRTASAIENQWVGLTLGPRLTLGETP